MSEELKGIPVVEDMNIYEKLSVITAELQTVAKNLTVQQTKSSSYKAVSERDILDAVKPLEEKYRVYSYPKSREVIESNLLESESTYNNQVTKKTTFMTRIKTVYGFVNIDKPDEEVEMVVFSEGIDSQDKGSGKAMTYADKYALMKAYKISTGEDPDQEPSTDGKYKKVAGTGKTTGTTGTTTQQNKVTYSGLVKIFINENGLSYNKCVKYYGLTSKTTEKRCKEVFEELQTMTAEQLEVLK